MQKAFSLNTGEDFCKYFYEILNLTLLEAKPTYA